MSLSRVEIGVAVRQLGAVVARSRALVGLDDSSAEARIDFLFLELEVGVIEHVRVVKIVLIDGDCQSGRRFDGHWSIQVVLGDRNVW